jgi:crotonobetainyl-CoA:carnitine CoA-transferase CaiB-like acyl-CoA transferase
MVVEVSLASGKTVRMPGNPIKLSASAPPQYSCPPAMGKHTDDILESLLGYSQETIRQLHTAGAIE